VDGKNAPWHAHVYYTPSDRSGAEAFRERLINLQRSGDAPQLLFIGQLRDQKAGPHPVPQFEIHFTAELLPGIKTQIREVRLTALVHPLTSDDLADHTQLGEWLGTPIDLDLTVLDPPGINQGLARFGKADL
jgi:DOPA 4,5-dioxygenase